MKDVKLVDLEMLAVSSDTGIISQEIQGVFELDNSELLSEVFGGNSLHIDIGCPLNFGPSDVGSEGA